MNILLQDNGDGGEIVLESGDIKADETLLTALYLSLFTGKTFYNVYEDYETDGDFEEALNQPITKENLQKTELAAKKATQWFVDEGVADSVEVVAYGDINEKQNVDITITEPTGESVLFGIIWQNEKRVLQRKN